MILQIRPRFTMNPKKTFSWEPTIEISPNQNGVLSSTLMSVLEDREKVSDEIRAQLHDLSEEEITLIVKKVKQLLDWRLMGMAWIMFICNYFDRVRVLSRLLIMDA